jgi:hypothetical protein
MGARARVNAGLLRIAVRYWASWMLFAVAHLKQRLGLIELGRARVAGVVVGDA